MFGLGAGEILIVLVVGLIFIGPKKLPGLAKGLGKGLRDFQNAVKGIDLDEDKNDYSHHNDDDDKIVKIDGEDVKINKD